MSGMKINNIGNGNETKRHHLSLPNKSEKKSNQNQSLKNQQS